MPSESTTRDHQPSPKQSRGSKSERLALRDAQGKWLALPAKGRIVLGSRGSVDLKLEDPFVSGRHAEIASGEYGVTIRDLGSKNGTWVDGVRVRQAWLGDGTRLAIGGHQLSVVAADRPDREPGAPLGPPMVGRSPEFQRVLTITRKLADLRPPVLITGETGTGKELVAQALHQQSSRATQPLISLNCAAIPESLAESQLFGHARGAFTGADRTHAGAFARANGGTLFLDEVGELPWTVQAKLLRALETSVVCPVGSERELRVDVRVISATHRPLQQMVAEGKLREDLFHRLSVFEVRLPPLRDRKSDIPPLIDHFLAWAARELGRELSITQAAVDAASEHAWPGNIRALRNAILRAAALCEGPITTSQLLGQQGAHVGMSAGAAGPEVGGPDGTSPSRDSAIYVPRGNYASMQLRLLKQVVEEQGSIRQAARVLKVPRSTLWNWLNK